MFAIHKREILLPLWIWLGCSTLLTRLKERYVSASLSLSL
uniref:Uncharacterized protein n=1 Tax=Brassica oleracea TaxID=3712 RepID=A0A3P6DGV0_BRAOL|nr:unnamed protein product [Brassica oleracea]